MRLYRDDMKRWEERLKTVEKNIRAIEIISTYADGYTCGVSDQGQGLAGADSLALYLMSLAENNSTLCELPFKDVRRLIIDEIVSRYPET